MGGCGARPLAVPPPRDGTSRGLGRGAQAKPHTMAVYGPHIYGPHICGPHIYGPHIYGPHICRPHIYGPHICRPHICRPHIHGPHIYSAAGPKHRSDGRWSQTPVGSVASIGPHKQNHTQGEWSQIPYEPPDAGFNRGLGPVVPNPGRKWSQTPVGSVASIGMHKQDHAQGRWSQTL